MNLNEQKTRTTLESANDSNNYSIMAGAGGGKTTLLSKRICQQICNGTPIERFVIITYTNAAAAELREKIITQLQEKINSDLYSSSEKNNMQNAINSIELMQISTIHAFLLKILKENSLEAGIAIDARMLEDAEDQLRKTIFFNNWYHDHYNEVKLFHEDWTITQKNGTSVNHTREVFKEMFDSMANIREQIQIDTSDHTQNFYIEADQYLNDWLNILLSFQKELCNNAPKKKDGTLKKFLKDTQTIIDTITTVSSNIQTNSYDAIENAISLSKALQLIHKFITSRDGAFYGKSEDASALTNYYPTFPSNELAWNFDILYNNYLIFSQKAARTAEKVAEIAHAYQKEIDQETLCLSNDDILYRSEQLLTKNSNILNKLKAKYTYIYVDEFQDTTRQQAKIIKLLSEKINGANQNHTAFTDSKLIVVGDPKQSIYRFTGAEKSIFDDFHSMMTHQNNSANTAAVSLTSNFRSNETVITWINNHFQQRMGASYTNMSSEWSISNPDTLHGVFKYSFPPQNNTDKETKQNPKDLEQKELVNLIDKLVNGPYYLETNSPSKELRKIKYSDFMILCKNTMHLSDYLKCFSDKNIPVNIQGKFDISQDQILRNYIMLIEFFSNTKNLKNRFEALQIVYNLDITNTDENDIKDKSNKLFEFKKYFKENNLPSSSIAQYLMEHEDLYIPKRNIAYTKNEIKTYRSRLHQMLEYCLDQFHGDLADLVQRFHEYMNTDVKKELSLESSITAVQLMNIHQAKGLTGNIVIIADRSSAEKCRYSGYKKNGSYYPAACYRPSKQSAQTIFPTYGYSFANLNNAYIDETEENARLEYVAATRAAYALIIFPPLNKNCWFSDPAFDYNALPDITSWLSKHNTPNTNTVPGTLSTTQTASTNTICLQDLQDNLNDILQNKTYDKLKQAKIISIAPSDFETTQTTGYQFSSSEYKKEDRPSGKTFGTVMHRVYELLILRREHLLQLKTDEEQNNAFCAIIRQAIFEQSEELQENDFDQFERYLSSIIPTDWNNTIKEIITNAKELYPEYTFSFFVTDAERNEFIDKFQNYFSADLSQQITENNTIWINGQADLVAKNKDGSIIIYDYKSDSRNGKELASFENALAKKYEGQLALYQYAIQKTFQAENNLTPQTKLIHLYRNPMKE